MCLIHYVGGAFTQAPQQLAGKISKRASDLIDPRCDPFYAKMKDLTETEADPLREIYQYNPLLFDFVFKRTLKLPGTDRRLPAGVFMTNAALGV